MFAALATVLSLGALGLALLQRGPSGRPAARAETVTLEVHVDPGVASTIVMDGRTTAGPTARTTAPRSTTPIAVDVTAPGFVPARLRIVPDHDRLVTVPLTPLRAEPLPRSAEPE